MTRKILTPLTLQEQTDPSTPPSGFLHVYPGTDGKLYYKNDAGEEVLLGAPEVISFSKTGVLSVAVGTFRWYAPRPITLLSVRASVGVAPTGAAVIVDVNENGTTIFTTQSNRPEIAISGFTDVSGTIEEPAIAAANYLTVDIDQIGSTIAGSDLTVQVEYI